MASGGSPNDALGLHDTGHSARDVGTPLNDDSGRVRSVLSTWSIDSHSPWEEQVQTYLRRLEDRAAFMEAMHRKRSAYMLFAGAISGLLGFIFAFIIGVIQEETFGKFNADHVPYASGLGYFPATVSEMVHDPLEPAGKCFFAFCFVGAIFIFFSWYPTQLRTVYIGDDAVVFCGMSWVTFRQFVPASGMMMLSIITTVPMAEAYMLDYFCIALHLTGAFMLFVGYFVAEAHAIGHWPFRSMLPRKLMRDSPKSIRHRNICLTVLIVFFMLFCVLQGVLMVPHWIGIPDSDLDQWGQIPGHYGILLTDTAHWNFRTLKILSYMSEVVCGLALIVSHLLIWYNCEERQYDLPEELRPLGTHFGTKAKSPDGEEHDDEDDDLDSEEDDASDSGFVGRCG